MANTADDIFSAIGAGDAAMVAGLIANDPRVARARNDAGVPALMQARYLNKLDIVALLRSVAGELDLYEAAALGDITQLQTLLTNDREVVNSRSPDGFTPLHLACFFGQCEAAEMLTRVGADPNALSASGIYVIHSATASRDAAVVKLVLRAGANPNAQQQGGYTALQSAAAHNNVEMIQALLDAGADRSIANDQGHTASDMAVKNNAKEVAALLEAG